MRPGALLLRLFLALFLTISVGFDAAEAVSLRSSACTDNPSLLQVSPASLTAGQTVQLSLLGLQLERPSVTIDFGPGIIVLGTPAVQTNVGSGTMYTVSVNVLPTAQPGARAVQIKYCSGLQTKPTAVRLVVTPAAPQPESDAATRGMFVAPQCTDNPRLDSMNPFAASQGQLNLQLELRGWDLDKPGVMPDFGPGVVAIGRPLFKNRISENVSAYTLGISVLPGAPPGPHRVSFRYCNGAKTMESRLSLLVTASQPGGATAPQVQTMPSLPSSVVSVAPSQWQPGKTYHLILTGLNLASGMEVRFGSGVKNKGVMTVLGPTQAKLEVEVEASAQGSRKAEMRMTSSEPWKETSAIVFIQTAEVAKQPAKKVSIKLPAFLPELAAKGSIVLDQPAWRQMIGSQVPPKGPDGKPLGQPTPIYQLMHPVLNDALVFDWHEQHFGVAEWFEIRFFRKGSLIAKRKIEEGPSWLGKKILPSYFRPDGPLVAELMKAVPALTGGKDQAVAQVGVLLGGNQSLEMAVSSADLAWEVAGYRRYASNGVVKAALSEAPAVYAANPGQQGGVVTDAGMNPAAVQPVTMKDVEVEISERWPLFAPYRPTGMNCSTDVGKSFLLRNIDKKDIGATGNYPYDRWRLTGTFNFSKSPYAAHAATSQTATPDTKTTISGPFGSSMTFGSESQVLFTAWSFENVFIDWGDGTVQPLAIVQGGDAGKFNQDKQIDLSKSAGSYEHAYAEPGTYTVRLYQLSNDDVQKPQAAAASYLHDSQAGLAMSGLYGQAVALGGGGESESYPVAKQIADRAYMLFCQKVTISPLRDPLAEGPLRLVDIAVQGFPGFPDEASLPQKKTQSAKPSSASSAEGIKKAATGLIQAGAAAGLQQAEPSAALGAVANALLGSQTGTDVFTTCDGPLTAGARLRYYGKGKARVRWFLDNLSLGSGDILPLGPSPERSQDVLAGKTGGSIFQKMFEAMPVFGVEAPIPSPPVAVGASGNHAVRVEAEVVHDAKTADLKSALSQALLGKDAALAAGLADGLKGGPRIGVLSPIKTPAPGWKAAAYLNDPLMQSASVSRGITLAAAAGGPFGVNAASVSDAVVSYGAAAGKKKEPPDYVTSEPRPYTVKKPAEGPCTFDFPVKDGVFRITGLQDAATGKFNVTHVGNVYSGKGSLRLKLPTASGAVAEWPVPVSFKDWTINADGFTVDKGVFDIKSPGLPELSVPALKAKLASVKGTAKDRVDAAFTFRLINSGLKDANSATTVPSWPLPVSATLSPGGDWYAAGLKMPELLIYDTGFRFASKSVAIDLSTAEGEAHADCQGQGKGFMGVRMSDGMLTAYDFDLPGANTAAAETWGIDPSGICGSAKTGPFQANYLKGQMKWDSVTALAKNGDFTATYENLRVKVPWLNVELKGSTNPVLKAGSGKVQMKLTGGDAQVKNGPVSFAATNLLLESYKISDAAGNMPAVRSDSRFDFSGGDKPFAKDVWVKELYFGLDGKAYLKGQATLGSTAGVIAKAPITLKKVTASASAAGASRLRFDFLGDITLSKSGSLVGEAPVTYGIDEPADGIYAGFGPQLGSMTFETEFPKTTKAVKAAIAVKSVDISGASASAMNSPALQLAFHDDGSSAILADATPSFITVAAANTPQIVFKGSVDLGMFPGLSGGLPGGGAPKGGFVLGYIGDEDFWSAKVSYSMPGSGIVIVPEIVHLRGLNGGLGYNVTKESLQHQNLEHAVPASGSGTMLNVGMNVGSGDGYIYTLQGDMTIPRSPGDFTPQLDFRGWIFVNSPSPSSQEDVAGFVTYSSGLHGEIWSPQPKHIIKDYVWVNVPKGSTAVHFGTGDWYIHVGTKATPITGHLFVVDANAYFMIGLKDGLKVGGGGSYYKELGDCDDGFCVYIDGGINFDGSITISPLHVSASAHAHGSVGGCYEDHCLGIGGGLKAQAGVWPPDLAFGVTLDLPCPLPDVTGGIRLLQTPGLWGPSLDWCDLNPFW